MLAGNEKQLQDEYWDIMLETLRTIALSEFYLLFCMAVMVIPMIALSIWYHSNINDTEGGRALMKQQNAWRDRGGNKNIGDSAHTAGRLAAGIQSGHFGEHAKRMQTKVYWVVALWILACTLCFGLLIWAQETNPSASPQPQPAPPSSSAAQ